MRTILYRLAELLGLCFIMSPISCALYYYGFIPNTDTAYSIVLLIVTIIFVTANVFMLRRCYFELRNRKLYFLLNYIAYFLFMGITAAVFLIFGQIPYAWLFNSLKLIAFSEFDLSTADSTAVTHALMLCVIALAPIGMNWVFELPEEEFDEEELEEEELGEEELAEEKA